MSVSLAIDIGNTRVKGAVFEGSLLSAHFTCGHDELRACLREQFRSEGLPVYTGVSCVAAAGLAEAALEALADEGGSPTLLIDAETRLPIPSRYATPHTLGTDRICLAVGAWTAAGGGPVLVADAGTALTFDFVDAAPAYRGGSIAPGLQMRFRALNEMTARLPRVEAGKGDDVALIGDSTEAAIRSGVILGMAAEIDGIAARYRAEFGSDLPFYITGGDSVVLLNHLKSINFVDFNILLKGIHAITHHHFEHA